MIKIALLMGFEVQAVTLNKEHAQMLTKIITKFVREHIEAGSARFLGKDGIDRLKNTMPAKLRRWQEKSNSLEAPISLKRASPNWEVELNALAEGAPILKAAKKANVTASGKKTGDDEKTNKRAKKDNAKAAETAAIAALQGGGDEACGSAVPETPAVEQPVHDLAQMIKQWKS